LPTPPNTIAPAPLFTKPPVPKNAVFALNNVDAPNTWKCNGFPPAVTDPFVIPVFPSRTKIPPLVTVNVFNAPEIPKSCPTALFAAVRFPPWKNNPPPESNVKLFTVAACCTVPNTPVTAFTPAGTVNANRAAAVLVAFALNVT
jgi:hypothetical protein